MPLYFKFRSSPIC